MRTSFTHLVTDSFVIGAGRYCPVTNIIINFLGFIMARIRQRQNIDNLIQNLEEIIAENRCSLSDNDIQTLAEALEQSRVLKNKKGKTNQQILEILVKVVGLFCKFFTSGKG